MAESADDPAERRRWLTFALVGVGPTGVELAGQVREVATKTLRKEFRHIKPEDARDLRRERGFTIDDMPIRAYSEQAHTAAGGGRHAIRPANTHDGSGGD